MRERALVQTFANGVQERFGTVDVLVNHAGGSFCAPFTDVSMEGEQMLIAENFISVTQLVRRFVPLMTGGGSIVNVTSVEAHQAAPARWAPVSPGSRPATTWWWRCTVRASRAPTAWPGAA